MSNDSHANAQPEGHAFRLLGSSIRVRREARKLSQRAMAKATGLQQATLNKIELGKRLPTGEQARAIAKFFDYELTELHLTLPQLYPAPPVEHGEAA